MSEKAPATQAKPTSPAKKAAKPNVPKSHPPVSDMVIAAIKTLKERGGSSLQAIKKYLAGQYKVDVEKLSPFIKKYLRSAVTKGALLQTKGKGASGSFKLPAAAKKEKAPKKPKAEKTKAVKPKKTPAKKSVAKKPKAAASPTKVKKPVAKTAKKPAVAKAPKKAAAAKPKAVKPKATAKPKAAPKPKKAAAPKKVATPKKTVGKKSAKKASK